MFLGHLSLRHKPGCHMTKIAATPIYFMKPTPVDNQSVISATATTMITATAATDKLKTSVAATLTT